MNIWAISDLHLSLGDASKSMEVFGDSWKDYVRRIEQEWKNHIQPEDLVLVPGDISWAKNLDGALIDLNWIDSLPGTKVIIKGNHDYWWDSSSKMQKVMPPSIKFIQNDVFNWNGVSIGGSRLWDTEEYNFNKYIEFVENPRENKKENTKNTEEQEKIYTRELERLKLSLNKLDPKAKVRIALTHYPPVGADLSPSKASAILENYKIDICVFGHLHSVKRGVPLFGEKNGVKYIFAS
ncbi:MAG: phosphoesterase, partial [Chlamydiae bacterium]|nr:phosphoesterase [Chlamydiota bacterium]